MWFWWAVLAAMVSAVAVVMNKKVLHRVNASVLTWSLFALNIPLVAMMAFSSGGFEVNREFFVGAIASSVIFTVSKTITLSAIKIGSLSNLAPLSSFAPVVIYLLGVVVFAEHLSFLGSWGLILVVIGLYVLKTEQIGLDLLRPFKKLLSEKDSMKYLLGVVLTSTSAIFDKMAIINVTPQNPGLVLLMENVVIVGLITFYLQLKKPGWVMQVKDNFGELMANSLVYAVSVIMIFMAFGQGSVALASAIKQTQVLLVLFLGWWWLGDKPKKANWLAAGIMVAGVLLIKLS